MTGPLRTTPVTAGDGDVERGPVNVAPPVETATGPSGDKLLRPAATDRLANERTYLAWVRTGLACFALCVGIGAVLPRLARGEAWPFVWLGAGFGLLGVWLMGYAHVRRDSVERAIEQGHEVPADRTHLAALGIAAALLGLALVVFVVVLGFQ